MRSGNFKDIFHQSLNIGSGDIYDEYESDNDNLYNQSPSKFSNNDDNHSVSSSGSSFFYDPYSSSLSTNNVKDVKKSEWIQILKKSQVLHKFSTVAPPTNGAEMFNILWEPALSILQFHLRFAGHPKVLDRVVQV